MDVDLDQEQLAHEERIRKKKDFNENLCFLTAIGSMAGIGAGIGEGFEDLFLSQDTVFPEGFGAILGAALCYRPGELLRENLFKRGIDKYSGENTMDFRSYLTSALPALGTLGISYATGLDFNLNESIVDESLVASSALISGVYLLNTHVLGYRPRN